MTAAQERTLEYLRKVTLRHMHGSQEIRELYIEELDFGGKVSVRVVVSTAEGTFGHLFPDQAHWFIGRGGGVTFYRYDRRVPGHGFRHKGTRRVRVEGRAHAWQAFFSELGRKERSDA